jgi:hypothetical protein
MSKWYAPGIANEEGIAMNNRAKLHNSTTVFLVGNIERMIEWYKRLGFESAYYPPGFAILQRDAIEIFLQHLSNYMPPVDPGRSELGTSTSLLTTSKSCSRSTPPQQLRYPVSFAPRITQ